MSQDKKMILGVLGIVVLIAVVTLLSNQCTEPTDASDREPIPCPSGYTDCTGIPIVSTPEPVATVAPTVAPSPTAVPTETRFSCRHTHDGSDGVWVHYQRDHINPNPARGVFDIYNAERCGH